MPVTLTPLLTLAKAFRANTEATPTPNVNRYLSGVRLGSLEFFSRFLARSILTGVYGG